MALGLIGKKMGMTQLFDAQGKLVPVTVVQAGPCPVIQKKTVGSDGYNALQLGFENGKRKLKNNKPLCGHFQKVDLEPLRVLREFRIENVDEFEQGQNISVEIFKASELVNVTGVSRGRGFTGVMKRHGYAGKDRGHGTHEAFRHGGSIGCQTPKRVVKGRKMPGRMGGKRFSTKNLKIMFIDKENNLLLIKGAVPGWKNGYVLVKKP